MGAGRRAECVRLRDRELVARLARRGVSLMEWVGGAPRLVDRAKLDTHTLIT